MKFSLVVSESLCVAPLIVEISTMEIHVDMTRKYLERRNLYCPDIYIGILISRKDFVDGTFSKMRNFLFDTRQIFIFGILSCRELKKENIKWVNVFK